jgi:hypothetical protein
MEPSEKKLLWPALEEEDMIQILFGGGYLSNLKLLNECVG